MLQGYVGVLLDRTLSFPPAHFFLARLCRKVRHTWRRNVFVVRDFFSVITKKKTIRKKTVRSSEYSHSITQRLIFFSCGNKNGNFQPRGEIFTDL